MGMTYMIHIHYDCEVMEENKQTKLSAPLKLDYLAVNLHLLFPRVCSHQGHRDINVSGSQQLRRHGSVHNDKHAQTT